MKAICTVLTLLIACGLYVLNLQHGPLNQDEGWYLLAARNVSQGELPYSDFAYTQAPVFPFVYALGAPVVNKWGVRGARVITQVFGGFAILFAVLLADRLAAPDRRRTAFCAALILVTVNVYQSYFFTVVKTYALCAFFLMLGLYLLSLVNRDRNLLLPFLTGFLLALAAGTRISSGLTMPLIGFYLLAVRRQVGDKPWLSYGVGGGCGLVLVFLPLYLAAPDQLKFGIIDYHTGREAEKLLTLKAGFISRVTQAWFVCLSLLGIMLLMRRKKVFADATNPSKSENQSEIPRSEPIPVPRCKRRLIGFLWAVVIAITVLHLMAAVPYDDYQTFLYPLLAALVGVAFAGWLPAARHSSGLLILLLLCIASAFSSPINQDWFVRGRDRIWWRMKSAPDLVALEKAAEKIRAINADGPLLTQDAYLAVQAGMEVLPGFEMGPFSYYSKAKTDWADRHHLLNRELLLLAISESNAPVAAFSEYSLCIDSPGVTELPVEEQVELRAAVDAAYESVETIEHFGHGHTRLVLYRRRTAPVD